MFALIVTFFTFATYLIETKVNFKFKTKTMNTIINISNSNFGTSSRNGNGIFCSNFTGRNIGKYSGFYDAIGS